ncbi:MAG TPA: twin-arginine translocation signal domain-containing protein, partial [Saprospiraceae bacterium]|nr:twin-arginine translocation signal domain-containing protein [Saprospiraceae bacterium]
MAETRRTFLKKAGLAGAAMTIHPFSIFSQGSPNERVRVAVMGVRSRGLALAKEFAGMKDTEVAYLCDVDQRFLDNAIAEVSSLQASRPKGEKDIRKIL